jgi:hypothetical protein
MPAYGRRTRLRLYAWLRSEDTTPVVCRTSVGRHNSDRMPNSIQRMWLRSKDMTLVVYPDSRRTSQFWSTSWLRSYLLTSVAHQDSGQWACRMSYHLSYKRLCMAGLDDCGILQHEHLVKSRLGGTHDSFNIWNSNISQLRMLKCLAMCRTTNEH